MAWILFFLQLLIIPRLQSELYSLEKARSPCWNSLRTCRTKVSQLLHKHEFFVQKRNLYSDSKDSEYKHKLFKILHCRTSGFIVRAQKTTEIVETTTAVSWWWTLIPGLIFGVVSMVFGVAWGWGNGPRPAAEHSRGTRRRVGHSPKETEAVSVVRVCWAWFELVRDLAGDLRVRFGFITSALCCLGSSFSTLIISREILCR